MHLIPRNMSHNTAILLYTTAKYGQQSQISLLPRQPPTPALNRPTTYASLKRVAEMAHIHVALNRRDIAYVRFIFEGYDGLGIVSILDPHRAVALIQYPACQHVEARALILALRQEGAIKEVIAQ